MRVYFFCLVEMLKFHGTANGAVTLNLPEEWEMFSYVTFLSI